MIKQNFPRLLETNVKIRELKPNLPGLIIQHAIILELSGDLENANIEYKKGIEEFEKVMASNADSSWELELEYAYSLVMANDYQKAQSTINRLKKENPDLEIWKVYKLQTKNEVLEQMTGKRT